MFPEEAESRARALGVFRLPFRNRNFTLLVGLSYLFFAWMLQSASKASPIPCGSGAPAPLLECIVHGDPGSWLRLAVPFLKVLQHSPANVFFAAVVIVGCWRFRASEDKGPGQVWGLVHGTAHVALNFVLIWVIATVNLRVLGMHVDSPFQAGLFGLEMIVGGGIAGAALFAIYLWISSLSHGFHLNEVFSSQGIADCKHFVRMRISEQGTLTIHAVGVPKVPKGRAWVPRDPSAADQPLYGPPDGRIATVRIDGPVDCD